MGPTTGVGSNEPMNFTFAHVDPMALDLETADGIAEVTRMSNEADGVLIPTLTGPAALTYLQFGSDMLPVDGLWLAYLDNLTVGWVTLNLPWRNNTEIANLRGNVRPEFRAGGVGRALVDRAVRAAAEAGRTKIYAGTWKGSAGMEALPRLGFSSDGLGVNAIRRVDVHDAPAGLWERLYAEALADAAEYELVHQIGPTPQDMVDAMVTLHQAITDAPLDDPELEADAWDADRVRSYDRAMAGRRQTVYRTMARHKQTGDWAGLSMLCVDEFSPAIAFQEDTSVVRAHRGHRLGLLMKADMLRWISQERPELSATDTWNATTNHHMIAVNEKLGATVVATHVSFRLQA